MYTNRKGISNVTIGALVVISLVVSMVGTWLVLETLQSKYVAAPVQTQTVQSGYVELNLGSVGADSQRVSSGMTGLISLNVRS